jgi:hypothetical protein
MIKYVKKNLKVIAGLLVIFGGGVANADCYLHQPRNSQNVYDISCANGAAAATWCATQKASSTISITDVNGVTQSYACDYVVETYQNSDCPTTN